MQKDYFVYLIGDYFFFTKNESSVPPTKIAARVPLTKSAVNHLAALAIKNREEYQSMLMHYWENGQKVVM